jgi:TnpA family transposase
MEVGRVNKTLYLLNYIDDEDYRRRILTQLNRGEGRHAVARAICYGQRGEIESAIVKVRKINWVHWASSLTQWYCGTHFICRKP